MDYTKCVLVLTLWCYCQQTECKYIGGYYRALTTKPLKINNINPHLVTHIYYSFVEVHPDGTMVIQNKNKGYIPELVNLKKVNPKLKLLFSLVSVNQSFGRVIADKELKDKVIQNGYELVRDSNFDGLDIDWEFPSAADKENFTIFVKELSGRFKKHDYLVTAAVNPMPISAYGYDVPELSKYLDVINLMTYNFYGPWSEHTGLISGLYPSSLDSFYEKQYLNINSSVQNWIKAGASQSILAIGIPFYGQAFNLTDERDHGIHSPISGKSKLGTQTYFQILSKLNNYTTVWDDEQKGYYKYRGPTWISYEDEMSVIEKCKYVREQDLNGVFVWHLGADDVTGELTGVKQNLLQVINNAIN